MAMVAKKAIKIEERGLSDVVVCADVPERQRIRILGITPGHTPASMMLHFVRPPYDECVGASEEEIILPIEAQTLVPMVSFREPLQNCFRT